MGQVVTAKVGEAVFLPRSQAYAFYLTLPAIRMLIMTDPGGLDGFFE